MSTPTTPARFMTEAELQRFLQAAGTHPDGAVLTVAVTTGLRLGELLGLRWQDVDMDAGTLRVAHQLQINVAGGGGWHLTMPKTDTSLRTLPLPAVAVAALKRQQRCQLEDRVLAGGKWEAHGFVFTGPYGQPMQRPRVRRALKAVLSDAGISDLRVHDLRHSFASYLIAHGADLLTVKELCGHKSIQITADVYGHLFPRRKSEAMATWDRLQDMAS